MQIVASLRNGRYLVEAALASGAQGRVFQAIDRVSARRVVLKVAGPGQEDSLSQEFRRLSAVDHPHIVQVLDLFWDQGLKALVLVEEFIAGSDLQARIGELTTTELKRVELQLLAALDYLVASRLRHGDIKPTNIMLRGKGAAIEAVLIDFGFAEVSGKGPIRGATPLYMAPEIIADESSLAADLWALGLTLMAAHEKADPPFGRSEINRARESHAILAALLVADPHERMQAFQTLIAQHSWPLTLPQRLPFVGREREVKELRREVAGMVARDGPTLVTVKTTAGLGSSRIIEEVLASLSTAVAPSFFRDAWFDLELLIREIAADLNSEFDLELGGTKGADDLALSLWALCERQAQKIILGLGHEALASEAGQALRALALRQDRTAAYLHVMAAEVTEAGDEELKPLSAESVEELFSRLFPRAATTDAASLGDLAREFFNASAGIPGLLELLLRRALETESLDSKDGRLKLDRLAFGAIKVSRDELPIDPFLRQISATFSANQDYLDRAALHDLIAAPSDRIERGLLQLKRSGLVRDTGRIGSALHYLGPKLEGPEGVGARWVASADERLSRLQGWYDLGDYEAVLAQVDAALAATRGAESAALLFLSARALAALSDHSRALERLAALRALGSALIPAHDLALLEASCWSAAGDRVQALAALAQASDEVDEPDGRAQLLSERAYINLLSGKAKNAESLAASALASAATPSAKARAAVMLATAHRQTGDRAQAAENFSRAEEIFSALKDDRRRAAVIANRAMLDVDGGRPAQALRALENARRLFHATGSLDQLAATTLNLGVARQHLRQFVEANQQLRESERLFAMIGDEQRANAARASRGISWLDAGGLVAARDILRHAEATAKSQDDGANLPRIQLELARLDFLTGHQARSRRRLRAVAESELDGPARRRQGALKGVLDSGSRLDELSADPVQIASCLRSRDLIERGRGLVAATALRAQQGRRQLSAAHFRRLQGLAATMEREMNETSRARLRHGLLVPVFQELMERLELTLQGGDGVALQSLRTTMVDLEASRDLTQSLTAVARGVLALGQAMRVYVVSWDGQKARVMAQARRDPERSEQPELSTMILKRVAARDEALVVADASMDDVMGFAASVQALGLRSVACFPLLRDGDPKLMLYLDTPLESGAFGTAELATLTAFSSVARIACSLHDRALRSEAASQVAEQQAASVRTDLISKTFEVERMRERSGFGQIVGASAATNRLRELIADVAPTDLAVLITGETGTGKEVIAQAIHRDSRRASGPFLAINCASLSPSLVESELFGHRRGAFTGAERDYDGVFVAAEGGTIFLDEVGELELGLQAKLLRVLDSGEIRPVGSDRLRLIDVRVVAATNRDVRQPERFRQDLYFRLAQMELATTALRDRPEDLPPLIEHFLNRMGAKTLQLEAEALSALMEYHWPGNVRELINVLERARVLAQSETILLTDLPEEVWSFRGRKPRPLADMEQEAIREALHYTGGEKKAAAALLGISRTALYEKLKRFGPNFA